MVRKSTNQYDRPATRNEWFALIAISAVFGIMLGVGF